MSNPISGRVAGGDQWGAKPLTLVFLVALLAAAVAAVFAFAGPAGAQSGVDVPRPVSVEATVNDDNTVSLLWWMPADAGTMSGYQVSRRDVSNKGKFVVVEDDTESPYHLWNEPSALEAGEYAYRVRAIYLGFVGPPSPAARVTVPEASAAEPEVELTADQQEIARLASVVEHSLKGCVVYEVIGDDGEVTYAVEGTSTSGIDFTCVPLRALTEIACVPRDLSGMMDDSWYTVLERNGDFYVGGVHEKFYVNEILTNAAPRVSALDNPGSVPVYSFVEVVTQHGGTQVEVSFIAGGTTYEYLYLTGEVDTPSGLSEEDQATLEHIMLFLYNRMNRIVDGSEEYEIPLDCRFRLSDDLRDAVAFSVRGKAFGEISPGSVVESTLDTGSDVDIFELALEEGVEYRFSVSGVAPGDVDTSPLHFVGSGEDIVDLVQPVLSLVDGEGHDLTSAGHGETAKHAAATDGMYYLVISRGDTPRESAGVYQVSLETANEGGTDFAAGVDTPGVLSVGGNAVKAALDAGDSDWFRVDLTGGEVVSFTVPGDVWMGTDLAFMDSSGNEVTSGVESYNLGGQRVMSVQVASDGTYYVAVSGSGIGSYRVKAFKDGHMPNSGGGVSLSAVTSDMPQEGRLFGSWDRDAFVLQVPYGQVLGVNVDVAGEGSVVLTGGPQSRERADGIGYTRDLQMYIRAADPGIWTNPEDDGSVKSVEVIISGYSGAGRGPAYTVSLSGLRQEPAFTEDVDPDTATASGRRTLTDNGDGAYSIEADLHKADGSGDEDWFSLPAMPDGVYGIDLEVLDPDTVAGMVAGICYRDQPCSVHSGDSPRRVVVMDGSPSSGTVVGIFNSDPSVTLGGYTLILSPLSEPGTDAGDTVATAFPVVNVTFDGVLDDRTAVDPDADNDVDMFSMVLDAGEVVDVRLRQRSGDGLEKSSGLALSGFFDADGVGVDYTFDALDPYKRSYSFRVSDGGTYYVGITGGAGGYSASIFVDEYPSFWELAPVLDVGTSYEGSLQFRDDYDYFKFVMQSESDHVLVRSDLPGYVSTGTALETLFNPPKLDSAVGEYSGDWNDQRQYVISFKTVEGGAGFSSLTEAERTIVVGFANFGIFGEPRGYTFSVAESGS